jgi:hypothetical protein
MRSIIDIDTDRRVIDAAGDSDGMCGVCRLREDDRVSEQMKILIAYDGSDCANAALEDLHLHRAGLPRVAEALIMSVAGLDHRVGHSVSMTASAHQRLDTTKS